MVDSRKYHPDDSLLQRYVEGVLPMGVNLAVASHIDHCARCRQLVPVVTLATADAWLAEPQQSDNEQHQFGDVLEKIVDQGVTSGSQSSSGLKAVDTPTDGIAQVRDRLVELPRLLNRIAGKGLEWKEIAAGIHQALLDVDSQTKCEYIYMDPGARVPNHSHLGNEYMLVLDGTIEDEFGGYAAGDFVIRKGAERHGQVTSEGCVCLFVTDAPLIFTEGKARLLNPLSRMKFWWSKLTGR